MSNYSVGANAGAPVTGAPAAAGAAPQGIDQATLTALQQNGIDPSTLTPDQLAQAQAQVQAMQQQQGAAPGMMGKMAGMSKMMGGLGGDSGNNIGIAVNSGLNARSIVAADKFVSSGAESGVQKSAGSILESAKGNLPLADALQQQSGMVRFAAKVPFVKSFLGPDFIVNQSIGSLSKDALNGVPKAKITQIVLAGGDVAKNLKAVGLPADAIKSVTAAVDQRAAALGEQVVKSAATTTAKDATQAAATTAASLTSDTVKQTLQAAKNGGMLAGKKVTAAAIASAVKKGATVESLRAMGLTKQAADAVIHSATSEATTAATTAVDTAAQTGAKNVVETGAKSAATSAAKKGATQVAETAAKSQSHGFLGGLFKHVPGKGFFGKLLSGAKGNFVVAGLFSLGSNAIGLATGKLNLKQFVALTAMDTAAYGGIGMGSAALGAAIGSVVPGAGTVVGFLAGLGIGMVGGWLYEKFLRKPVKNMLGVKGAGALPASNAAPAGMAPGAPQGPGAAPAPTSLQAAAAQDPYAANQAALAAQTAAAAAAPPTAQVPNGPGVTPYGAQAAPAPASPGLPASDLSTSGITFDQAMSQLSTTGAPTGTTP